MSAHVIGWTAELSASESFLEEHADGSQVRPAANSTGAGALRLRVLLLLGLIVGAATCLATVGDTRAPGGTRALSHKPARHGLAALPAAARGIVAQRLGAVDRGFWGHRTVGGVAFDHPRIGVDAQLSRHGVIVSAGALSWSIGLRALGRGGHLEPVGAAALGLRANQVTLAHAGAIEERYGYGPLGLEQGFTIGRRPAGPARGAVVLGLGDVPRGVKPIVTGDGRSMSLDRGGREVLRYWGLFASDARGRALPAWIKAVGRRLSLQVDDRGARYPLRIDPFVQAGKLTASDGAGGDVFGSSVAISGDTIVVGAPYQNNSRGAAYVFVKPANGWASLSDTAELTASDRASGDVFGSAVAISGDTIVVGAPYQSNNRGGAYVFVKPAAGWADGTETAKLTASDGTSNNWFGSSVAISGDTIVCGAWGAGSGFPGAAYVFVKPADGWATGHEKAILTASDPAGSDHLGWSVGISGDTIVAGAINASAGGSGNQGAAYVFVKPLNGWATGTQTAKLTASDGAGGDNLGSAVGVSGDTVVAGAPNATVSGHGGQGAAYVFVKPADGWATGTQTAKLTASDGAAGDSLGSALSMSGDTVVAGARASSSMGAAYVFTMPAGGWGSAPPPQDKLTASDAANGDEFGSSVGVDTGTIVVGAPDATVTGNLNQGAAYLFTSGAGGGGGGGAQPRPVNTAPPQITDTAGGVLRRGHVLSSSTGSWLNAPTAYAYQWQRCDAAGASCQPIASANTQTYTLTAADVGFTIRVNVTASNAGGSRDATSSPSAVVAAQLALTPDALDFGEISSGNGSQPQTVTVTNGSADPVRVVSVAIPAGPFAVTADGCSGATLQGGDSCTLLVTFTAPETPTIHTFTETLAVAADNQEPAATVSLSAVAIPANLPPGTIFGRVLDESNRPVAGVWVTISPLGATAGSRSEKTAADGSYASDPLQPGLYRLAVYPPAGALMGGSAIVRVEGGPVSQDFYLHATRPLSGGVTFTSASGGTMSSGLPVVGHGYPFSFHVPVHIPTGAPNSVHVYAILGGVGPDSGAAGSGEDVAGAEVFSVFYNAQGWPTRMSPILVGALDCGPPGSTNACGRLAAVGVAPGALAAADLPRLPRGSARAPHPGCDVNGNYVPDKYYDGSFHMIPNDKGGIDFIIPLADGSPERVGFLWQFAAPIPSPTGDPLIDAAIGLYVGAANGALNAGVPAIGYYNAFVGALNGVAQLGDNPDPVAGGAQGLNALGTLLIATLGPETHGAFYFFANIMGGDVNAVLPGSPSTMPPNPNPCKSPPPGGGSGGGGGRRGGGGGGGGFGGNFYIDPSGAVETRGGVPVAGATVTLTRSETHSGRQRSVPPGSAIMAPGNRRNPDLTGLFGNFGWDVVPGYYQVSAHKRGCRGTARTPVLMIPPAFTNLMLRLRCARIHRTPTRLRLRVMREKAGTTVLRATVARTGRARRRAANRKLTGSVTFRVGRTTLWSSPLDPRSGTAVFDVPRLKLHGRFNATYSGNALYAPSHASGR